MTKLKPHYLSRRKKYYFTCLQIPIPIKKKKKKYKVYICFRASKEKQSIR